MEHHDKHRRRLIACLVAGGVVIPATRSLLGATAFAQDDEAMARLELSDPTAKALGYTHDATSAKNNPAWAEGERCSTCRQIQGNEGDTWRPCAIFPGKLVNANGWCSAWIEK